MYKKSISMSFEQATKILNDLLDVFQNIYEIYPLRLSTSVENAETKTITFRVLANKIIREISYRNPETFCVLISEGELHKFPQDEYRLDIIYKFIRNNRHFEITLFNAPDDLGYCSMLPNYDESTYVICNIVERRVDGNKKYEMTFGMDIEKGTFLELFEIVHYNTAGILREYPVNSWNCPIETALKDVIIL